MNQAGKPKLLIAVTSHDTQFAREIFGEEFDLVMCHTLQEAEKQLNTDIGLVACGVHFDDGHMFELLQLVRSTPDVHDIPFLLALGRGLEYSSAILRGIDTAAKSLGATAFVNIIELVASMGEEAAYEDIRRTVRRLLLLSSLNKSISSRPKPSQSASGGEGPRAV